MIGTPENVEPTMDMLIIIGKMLIYYCKINKMQPKLQYYTKHFEDIQSIEKYFAMKK